VSVAFGFVSVSRHVGRSVPFNICMFHRLRCFEETYSSCHFGSTSTWAEQTATTFSSKEWSNSAALCMIGLPDPLESSLGGSDPFQRQMCVADASLVYPFEDDVHLWGNTVWCIDGLGDKASLTFFARC